MLIQSILFTTMLAVADATCMGHLHRRAAENNTVEVSKFGYSGQIGPLLWQTLAAENTVCEKGENQSPINIGKLPSFTFAAVRHVKQGSSLPAALYQ
jgi:carbonic anhydrase